MDGWHGVGQVFPIQTLSLEEYQMLSFAAPVRMVFSTNFCRNKLTKIKNEVGNIHIVFNIRYLTGVQYHGGYPT